MWLTSASNVEQNSASPVSAAQIPLPPSPITQSVREDEPTSRPRTAQQPPDSTEKTKEKTEEKGPTLQESWKILSTAVEKYDEGMVKNWKEDIDTLLVFAGLFSAVVTAFLIEAYQWLSEDPADTTVMLLTQISMQLNTSQTMSMFPQRPEFSPDASSIRINCWWLLSLVFALTSALFGLLCKQWLREQQRDPPTASPAEALALRQIRRDSFEKWGVPLFLSVLPILLEVALLFFFVGILDLLWARHPIPFACCLVSVVLSAGLYFVTTFLPVLALFLRRKSTILDDFGQDFTPSYHFICSYKSPQAWAVYQLLFKALHTLYKIPSIESYIDKLPKTLKTHIKNPASDWSSFDLRVIRESSTWFPNSFTFNVYESRAFQWAFTTFQDSPSMLPHLQNVLGTIPPSVAMPAVVGDWTLTMWGDIQKSDVEFWKSPDWYIRNAPQLNMRDPTLLHSQGIKLLYFHWYWQELVAQGWTSTLTESIESHQADLQSLVNLRFVVPFPVIEKLWTHGHSSVQERCLRLLKDAFSTHPGYDEGRHERECLAFISVLINHLKRTDFASYVATSTRGQEFIHFVYDQSISRPLPLDLEWHWVFQRVIAMRRLPAEDSTPVYEVPEGTSTKLSDISSPHPSINAGHPLRVESENSVPQSDHDTDQENGVPELTERSEQGSVARDVGTKELKDDIPHSKVDSDHPQVINRHSEYEMNDFGPGDVPGSAERGEQSVEIGGAGAEERV